MKKYILFLIINFTALFFVWKLFFPAVETAELLSYRFTFVCPQIWDPVGKGVRNADGELGTGTRCIGLRSVGVSSQAAAIRKAVYSRVTGIITVGTMFDEELMEAIHEARQEQIPVLLIDSDIPVSERVGYVGPDNRKAGRQAGEEMRKIIPPGSRVAAVVSSVEDPNQAERLAGFREEIEKAEDVKIVSVIEDNRDGLRIKTMLQSAFSEEKIDAVYCATETSSESIGDALSSMGYKPGEITVVGFGMTERIYEFLTDGWYQATIMPDLFQEGQEAVRSLKNYIDRSNTYREHIYIDTEAVGKEFDYEGWLSLGGGVEVNWNLS